MQWWELDWEGGSNPGKPLSSYFSALSLEIGIVWLINYPHSFDISKSLDSGSSLSCGLMILQGLGPFLSAKYFYRHLQGIFFFNYSLIFRDIGGRAQGHTASQRQTRIRTCSLWLSRIPLQRRARSELSGHGHFIVEIAEAQRGDGTCSRSHRRWGGEGCGRLRPAPHETEEFHLQEQPRTWRGCWHLSRSRALLPASA